MVTLPTILIVDSDQGSRSSVADLLRDCGFRVTDTRGGIEALQLARDRAPALLIIDPWPYVSSSAQMVRRIRQLEGTGNLPVLVLTAANTRKLRMARRFADVGSYLEKPCPPDTLLSEVDRLLCRSARSAASATGFRFGHSAMGTAGL